MYWYALCGRAQNTSFLKPEGEKVTFSFFSHAKRKKNAFFTSWQGMACVWSCTN